MNESAVGGLPAHGLVSGAGRASFSALIHHELGKKSVTVQVKAGETKTAAVKFK